jgi:thiamine pyrophosphate-dependent acetolactate synthase large subunit-like protein
VQADVGSTLVALNEKLKTTHRWKGASEDWIKKLRERDDAVEQKNAKKMDEKPADGNINPLKLLGALDKVEP